MFLDKTPKSLESICNLITDGSHFSPTPQTDGFPIVNAKDIPHGKINLETCTRIRREDWERLKRQNCAPALGDILLSKDGTIGRVVHYDNDFGVVVLSSIAIIRPADFIDAGFLAYLLRSDDFSRQLRVIESGSALRRIILKDIKQLKFSFPSSKPEQSKITEILSTVDRAIEQTEALIAKQQRIKTGLMQDLLTRGIDEHGNLRSEETHEFQDSPLGRIPVEWDVQEWGRVCSKIQDGTHFSPRTDSSAKFKYVTSKNIKFGLLDLTGVEYINREQHDAIFKRCSVGLGDVLLTKDGANTGNAAINNLNEEFSLLSSVALIRPLEDKLTSMFLLQTILSEDGQRLIKDAMSGLAITRITLEIINNLLIKIPSIKEQHTIGGILAVQDERIKEETKKLNKLRSLKTALMQDLLTGKVRVTPLLKKTEKDT